MLQKCTTSISILAYGVARDTYNEYNRVEEIDAPECMQRFVEDQHG